MCYQEVWDKSELAAKKGQLLIRTGEENVLAAVSSRQTSNH